MSRRIKLNYSENKKLQLRKEVFNITEISGNFDERYILTGSANEQKIDSFLVLSASNLKVNESINSYNSHLILSSSVGSKVYISGALHVSGTHTFTGSVDIAGNMTIQNTLEIDKNNDRVVNLSDQYLNDNTLYMRTIGDTNHGIKAVIGPGDTFAGAANLDGPVLFGFNGCALGTKAGGENIALFWNKDGRVGIGTTAPNSTLEINLVTENLEIVDAGSVGATEQDWIEVEVGGVIGYIRVFATK